MRAYFAVKFNVFVCSERKYFQEILFKLPNIFNPKIIQVFGGSGIRAIS